jgi:hypothetical protein
MSTRFTLQFPLRHSFSHNLTHVDLEPLRRGRIRRLIRRHERRGVRRSAGEFDACPVA